METFSALLAICAGNSPVNGEFPIQRPVTRSFDVFCHLRLNKQLSKQSWGRWFETLLRPLRRHCNGQYFCRAIWHISQRLEYLNSCSCEFQASMIGSKSYCILNWVQGNCSSLTHVVSIVCKARVATSLWYYLNAILRSADNLMDLCISIKEYVETSHHAQRLSRSLRWCRRRANIAILNCSVQKIYQIPNTNMTPESKQILSSK